MSHFERLLPWLKDRWPPGKFGINVAVLASGAAAGQFITLAVSPVLTRLYPAADFGVLAVFSSVLTILTVAATLRYKLAIPLPEEESTAANVVGVCIVATLGMAGLVTVVLVLFGTEILRMARLLDLEPYLWLLPVGVVGTGVYQTFNYWSVRRGGFADIARTKLTRATGKVSTQIGFGVITTGPSGLVVGKVVGEIAGCGSLLRYAWRRHSSDLRQITGTAIREVAIRYKRFPIYSSGSSMLNQAGLEMPALLLASLYGAEVAGWFAVSRRVVGAPLGMLSNAVADVFIGEAPKLARKDPERLKRLFSVTTRRLAAIGSVPVVLVAIAGPSTLEFVFGTGWAQVGVYVRLLAVMFLAQFIVHPISQTLNVLERQDLQFVWDLGRLILVVGTLYVPYRMGLGHEWAIGLLGGVMALAYGVLFIMSKSVLPDPERRVEAE